MCDNKIHGKICHGESFFNYEQLYNPFPLSTINNVNNELSNIETRPENIWYNPHQTNNREDEKMSSMAVLRLGDSYIIASDSYGTKSNGETDKNYQKLFEFTNGVFGVLGANNFILNGRSVNMGDFIKEKILKDKTITPNILRELMQEFYAKYGNLLSVSLELVFVYAFEGKLYQEYFYILFNTFNHTEYISEPLIQLRQYAKTFATFQKGNTEFIEGAKTNPEEVMRELIKFNNRISMFVENERYIGGLVQMYKVYTTGKIENLSEER